MPELTSVGVRAQGDEEGAIEVSEVEHPSTAVHWGRAATELNVPKAEVLRVVEDYAGYKRFLPHFRASRVISRRERAALVYFEAQIAMFAFWSEMRVRPLEPVDDTESIAGKMIRGNAQLMEARWDIRSVNPRRTWVALQLILVPKAPLPASFVSAENASAARRAIKGLRKILLLPQ
jgi:ribosome-associated toxin RatA of RatAB toxin-antitoxin module